MKKRLWLRFRAEDKLVTRSKIVVLALSLGILLIACACGPQPIDGLWGMLIQTATPQLPTPTPRPTPTPKPDAEALFILNVIVEDRYGFLQEAMLTITWPDDTPRPFVVGPTADIKIPVLSSSHLFLLKIEKEGYITVYQPFDVTLNADMEYEFTVTILAAGDPA